MQEKGCKELCKTVSYFFIVPIRYMETRQKPVIPKKAAAALRTQDMRKMKGE